MTTSGDSPQCISVDFSARCHLDQDNQNKTGAINYAEQLSTNKGVHTGEGMGNVNVLA